MQLCAKFCYGPFEGEKFHLQLQKKAEYSNYGNTGCRVLKGGGHCVLNGVLRGHFLGIKM